MTDWLADTPVVARPHCPICEPAAGTNGELLDVRYCHDHEPARTGSADPEVAQGWVSGTADAGGEDNRAWCDFFHRKKTR